MCLCPHFPWWCSSYDLESFFGPDPRPLTFSLSLLVHYRLINNSEMKHKCKCSSGHCWKLQCLNSLHMPLLPSGCPHGRDVHQRGKRQHGPRPEDPRGGWLRPRRPLRLQHLPGKQPVQRRLEHAHVCLRPRWVFPSTNLPFASSAASLVTFFFPLCRLFRQGMRGRLSAQPMWARFLLRPEA